MFEFWRESRLSKTKVKNSSNGYELISAVVANEKVLKDGGWTTGEIWEGREGLRDERSLVILSLKKSRKAEGSLEEGIEKGSLGSEDLLSKLLSEVQSLRGWLILEEMRLRKNSLREEEINLETNLSCCLKLARSVRVLVCLYKVSRCERLALAEPISAIINSLATKI